MSRLSSSRRARTNRRDGPSRGSVRWRTRRRMQRLATGALTKSKSPIVWQAHVARHLEYRLEKAEARAKDAEKAATASSTEVARLQERLAVVSRITAPGILLQSASVFLAGIGGYFMNQCTSCGVLLLLAAAVSYAAGVWIQRVSLPRSAEGNPSP